MRCGILESFWVGVCRILAFSDEGGDGDDGCDGGGDGNEIIFIMRVGRVVSQGGMLFLRGFIEG